jgi:hypothetical protein
MLLSREPSSAVLNSEKTAMATQPAFFATDIAEAKSRQSGPQAGLFKIGF